MKKTFVGTVISLTLILQVYLPHRFYDWYWPFISYPMYSAAKKPGDEFRTYELRVIPCGEKRAPVHLSYRDLHVTYYAFHDLIENVSRNAKKGPVEFLNHLIADQSSISCFNGQIWRKAFVIGFDGLKNVNVPWDLAYEWECQANSPSLHLVSANGTE
jgi:hypothetical protein